MDINDAVRLKRQLMPNARGLLIRPDAWILTEGAKDPLVLSRDSEAVVSYACYCATTAYGTPDLSELCRLRNRQYFEGVQQMIMTVQTLAEMLGIDEDEAERLMQRKGFPAVEVAPGKFVTDDSAVTQWVRMASGSFKMR